MAGAVLTSKAIRWSALAFALAFSTGCPDAVEPPGLTLGDYDVNAVPMVDSQTCQLAELLDEAGRVASLTFVARLSQDEVDPARAYLTFDGTTRDATYEGFVLTSARSAVRTFAQCDCPKGVTAMFDETMRVVLLSEAQDVAVGGTCPPDALDGGIPAGIDGPQRQPGGIFPAQRACGEMVDVLVPGEGCKCAPCRVRYQLSGVRRQ